MFSLLGPSIAEAEKKYYAGKPGRCHKLDLIALEEPVMKSAYIR